MIDRSTLTPLEIAVWAATYVDIDRDPRGVDTERVLRLADEAIEALRFKIEVEARQRIESEANARHVIRYRITASRSGSRAARAAIDRIARITIPKS